MINTERRSAFTSLEMVAVIGILSVLLGIGIATVVPFKERREVLSGARSMASLLRQVQVKASAVEIPGGCDPGGVSEFEVVFSGSKVDLLARSPAGAVCQLDGDILNLVNGAEFVTAGSVVFKTPFGSATPTIISICNYGVRYDLEVTESGSVSEPKRSSC